MTDTFIFNSRETYKTFRSEWKDAYKAQSQLIRDVKHDIKKAYEDDNQDLASRCQYRLHNVRSKAREMMRNLEAAKEFKNAQLANRQQAA